MTNDEPRGSDAADVMPTEARDLVALPYDGMTQSDWNEDQDMMRRIEQLPREVGWLLIYVGVLGVVLPGVLGTPFLVAGAAIVSPGGPKVLARWVGRKPPRLVHIGMKQITRLVDDLDRRYPMLPKAGAAQK
ncbi:MAG TPA: hypothetical protein VJY39_02295 [Acidisphaera sp.]|nr:hypothetical protein [Acidisphaera sp.]